MSVPGFQPMCLSRAERLFFLRPTISTDWATAGRPSSVMWRWSLPVLVLLGMFAGMFAIPVQVYIQARSPEDQKGRMIAVMNQANFTAILLSGVIYWSFVSIVDLLDWQRSPMFAFTALVMLPVALFYRPASERLGE